MEFTRKDLLKQLHITRRNVIKLIIGGAAGIHLSPLPWKLTDDLAIWTQNWPWIPVPPVGEFTHEKSVCTLCPGGCGIEVRKVDNHAVKIEGRTDYPVNPGGICPLGAGGIQLLYNENIRFTGPMKRIGPRGSGKYTPISWEEALNALGHRIRSLRENGHPERLVAINGYPLRSSMGLFVERLLQAVGSPNMIRMPALEDTYALVNRLMQGNAGPMAYDLENADFILSFGCGLIEGWGAPGRMIHAWGLWHSKPDLNRAKIVQIESRASNTASKADGWLAPRPGTEAALALGFAHVIIREGLYNTSFIPNHTFGFMDWSDSDGKGHKGFKTLILEKYAPETVSKITGVNADHIVTVAKDFARSKAPIALFGKGKGELSGNLLECMAVHSLNALVGNINMPGGVLVHEPLPLKSWPDVKMDDIARSGLKNVRLDQAGVRKNPFSDSLIHHFSEAVLKNETPPVDTLLVFAANPASTLPDAGAFFDALKRVPFIVGFSPFRDETGLMADLVLPDHMYLEKREDIVWPPGLPYPLYGLSRPVVDPVYDTRHSGDVIIKLAEGIGASVQSAFPWKNFDDALEERVKGLFESGNGMTHYDEANPVWKNFATRKSIQADYPSFDKMWEALTSGGLWFRPTHPFKKWETIFKTPSGKFEFFSQAIDKALHELALESSLKSALTHLGMGVERDEACMPHYEPTQPASDREKYPILMIPYSLINLSTNWAPNPPYLNKTLFDHQLLKNESFADLNPQTATEYGLKQGDRVRIRSPKGELNVRVNLFEGAMPGVVYLPLGFGHWAYDKFQQNKGVNPNKIIDSGNDPISGHINWWSTYVQLIKV